MKRIIPIILLLSLVCGTFAQQDTLSKIGKIRPLVEVFAGYPMSEFYQRSDFFHRTPYTTGVLLGVALPEKIGCLLVNTGFILEGTSMDNLYSYQGNQIRYHHRLWIANFPVMLGYEGFVCKIFSLFGEGGLAFTHVIKRTEDIVNAKPVLDYLSIADSWDDLSVMSVAARLGVRYWFHPRFALFVDVTYKHYLRTTIESGILLCPTVSATIGVSFR